MKRKSLNITEDLNNRITEEKEISGYSFNTIAVMALKEYLKKKEKERK